MKNGDKIILAIETSCDDTSVAVLRNTCVLSNITYAQIIHKQFGGVVPESASRKHLEAIITVCREALAVANVRFNDIDAIAVTQGPGLMGSLMVGVAFAKGLSFSLEVPLIGVNHLEAHMWSLFIDNLPRFPQMCLTVSGGHTLLCILKADGIIQLLGQTQDDAAGEAFDKIGKLLGLPYPAGPEIDKLARKGTPRYAFPKAKMPGYQFSFSGLKTSVLYFLRENTAKDSNFISDNIHDLCASVQQNIVETLCEKLVKASEEFNIKEIGIAGGVSANSGLRLHIERLAAERNWNVIIPKISYCTDNAAMIGRLAFERLLNGSFAPDDMMPMARMPIIQNQQR